MKEANYQPIDLGYALLGAVLLYMGNPVGWAIVVIAAIPRPLYRRGARRVVRVFWKGV